MYFCSGKEAAQIWDMAAVLYLYQYTADLRTSEDTLCGFMGSTMDIKTLQAVTEQEIANKGHALMVI